jgi:hypothetical protein
MDISWADGQKILELARQNIGAKVAPVEPQDAPKTGTLNDTQAAAFQIMMMIQGHDGSTIGKGYVGPHNEPYMVNGKVAGWTRPDGDYFNGMTSGPYATGMQNPLAQPISPADGIAYEQLYGRPAPAPYGYTESGRPRTAPGQTDATGLPNGISEFAPGRKYGPTDNPGKGPTAPTGKTATNNGRIRAE